MYTLKAMMLDTEELKQRREIIKIINKSNDNKQPFILIPDPSMHTSFGWSLIGIPSQKTL